MKKWRKRIANIMAILLLLAAIPLHVNVLTVGATTITDITSTDYVTIINKNSGKLLDTVYHEDRNGITLVQWDNMNASSSQWQLALVDGETDVYNIIHRKSDFYLAAVNGKAVISNTVPASDASAQWRIEEVSTGYYKIINVSLSKGLNVSGANKSNGGRVILYTYNGGANEMWSFQIVTENPVDPVEDFVYIDRTDWTVTANSTKNSDVTASNIMDDDCLSAWQTSPDDPACDKEENPYEIIINLGKMTTFSQLNYMPVQYAGQKDDVSGIITQYEIYTSDDGAAWNKIIQGEWGYDYSNIDHSERKATFRPVTCRYVKFVILNNSYRQDTAYQYYAAAAEINLSNCIADIHPMTTAMQSLTAVKEQVLQLTDETRKNSIMDKLLVLEQYGTAEEIEAFLPDTENLLSLYQMQEMGVNAAYFNRLEDYLIENQYSSTAMNKLEDEMNGFHTLGKDIAEPVVTDLDDEYLMGDEDKEKTLIVRLKEAVDLAKAKIDANPDQDYKMLKELVAYVDDSYRDDGYYQSYGLDYTSCEYVTNNIKFALKNLEKIENGEIESVTAIKPGTTWLDTQGSKISANGGQIIKGHDGKYYWYGEDNKLGYALRTGVSCYSSTDLMNWTYEGLAFQAFKNDTEQSRRFADDLLTDNILGTKGRIERPKVIYNKKTKKYVMWMHLENNGGYGLSLAGVAISDDPTHGFEWLHYGYPVYDKSVTYNQSARQSFRDMNLFVDRDEKAYVYYASEGNPTMYAVRLNDDYTWIDSDGIADGDLYYADTTTEATGKVNYGLPSFTEKQLYVSATDALTFEGSSVVHEDGRWSRIIYLSTIQGGVERMREAPAPIRIGDTYYLVTSGCSGWKANAIMAFEAKGPLGPYKRQNSNLMVGTATDGSSVSNGFNSQSTCILKVGKEYMYMGDRWKNADYNHATSSIKRSTYIWLPLEVDDNGILSVSWNQEWTLANLSAGDINSDGEINTEDVLLILKHTTNHTLLTEEQKEKADVNCDGRITSVDALLLLLS
ncbi:MAG: RICIN domain-containing protein [Lachnospiraceae bacterium]